MSDATQVAPISPPLSLWSPEHSQTADDNQLGPIRRVFSFDEWEYSNEQIEKPITKSSNTRSDAMLARQQLCSNEEEEPQQISFSHSVHSAFYKFDLTSLDTSGAPTEEKCSSVTSGHYHDEPWCPGIPSECSEESYESNSMELSTPASDYSVPPFVFVLQEGSNRHRIFRNMDRTLEALTLLVHEDLENIEIIEI